METPLIDQPLAKIRETLIMMASLADRNLALALKSLTERKAELCDTVETEDSQLDDLEVQIDELVVTHMALRSPVARDCRFMLVATKVSSNLERIGDESVSIARRARHLNDEPLLKPYVDIPRMAEIARGMLHDAITAFVEAKPDDARAIIPRDKKVDELNKQLNRELTSFMVEDPSTITRALRLMQVARSLERVADHAKNIAEEVYFLYQAKDIRHQHANAHAHAS
jgi:phosphate transport system protein